MSGASTRKGFSDTEEGRAIRAQLQAMVTSSGYITDSSYSANTSLYPDNRISFVDRHMEYLAKHPSVDASQYVVNIKLMTKAR